MAQKAQQTPIYSGLLNNKKTEGYLFNADTNHPRYVYGSNHKQETYDLVPTRGKPFNCITTKTTQGDSVTISQGVSSLNKTTGWTKDITTICPNSSINSSIQPNGTTYILAGSSKKNTSTCKGSDNKLYEAHYFRNLAGECKQGNWGTNNLSQHISNQKPFDISSNNGKYSKCNDYTKNPAKPGTSTVKGKGGGVSLWARDANHNCQNITVRISDAELAKIHPCWVDQYKENNGKKDRFNPAPSGAGPYAQTFCSNECPNFYQAFNIQNPKDSCKPSAWKGGTWRGDNCKPCSNDSSNDSFSEPFVGIKKLDKDKNNYLNYHISPKYSNIDSDNIIQNIYIGCLSAVGIYIIYELYKK